MKFLILGGGPAGLSFANRLLENGETSFLVIEKEDEGGGLCRSKLIDGSPLDIGGGHFLDFRSPKVTDFLFHFMPQNEWNFFERDSRIVLDKMIISHPIEANIWQMDLHNQVEFLKSVALSGCNLGKKKPLRFVNWIYWKLGNKIADEYMIPYNKKIFGHNLNQLGTYWMEKLPSISFEETLLSCLKKKAYGNQPGHAHFYYPKTFGYGELWVRMANKIADRIIYNTKVCGIDFIDRSVITSNGERYSADNIITTIPWNEFKTLPGMPIDLKKTIMLIKHNSILVEYFDSNLNTDAHWLYYPNLDLSFHRALARHNFCFNSKGHWTETNLERVTDNHERSCFRHINEYAYPLNTIKKPYVMKVLLDWSREHQVYGLGRWGEHQHYNSDVTVEHALALADEFLCISKE